MGYCRTKWTQFAAREDNKAVVCLKYQVKQLANSNQTDSPTLTHKEIIVKRHWGH